LQEPAIGRVVFPAFLLKKARDVTSRFISVHATAITATLIAFAASVATAEKTAETTKGDTIDLLFVQSATSGSFDGQRLTLNGVGSTLLFSDRPARLDGHMDTANFLESWNEGPDSFATDPPNAVLSILAADGATNVFVELTDPKLDGTTLSYRATARDGTIPPTFGAASLFIDHATAGSIAAGGFIAGGFADAALGHSMLQASLGADDRVHRSGSGSSYRASAARPCPCECP
jgi:hypothetical protein